MQKNYYHTQFVVNAHTVMLTLIVFFSIFHLYGATEAPIIGILDQPTTEHYDFDTYLAASYVKFVESAGARVIPVWINQTTDYYERVIKYTNGLLFPGGDASFTTPGGYGDTARILYQLAVKSNDEGNFYPIWGTCLGFEVFPYVETGHDLLDNCSVDSVGLPLNFTKSFRESRLFEHIPEELVEIFSTENITFNYHSFCLTRETLKKHGLHSHWHVLTENTDKNGLEFISTMENRRYPFYGVQYHPEKNGFDFSPDYNFPHGSNGIKVLQYFANFFINEARKNQNSFSLSDLALKAMIYNYCPKFSALDNAYYFMMYGFYNNDHKNLLI